MKNTKRNELYYISYPHLITTTYNIIVYINKRIGNANDKIEQACKHSRA